MMTVSRLRLAFRLKARIRPVRDLACMAVFALGSVLSMAAQQAPSGGGQASAASAPASASAPADALADTEKASTPQTPQQKQLADDTALLLTLANELKAELDKSSTDTLSLGVIKKAQQVEKLAHKVRDEMKAGLR